VAKIVLGVGTSHSPMISTPAEHWLDHSVRDRHYPLFDSDGQRLDFDTLARENGERLAASIDPSAMPQLLARTDAALDRLREAIRAARPDICLVIGDDQDELFHHDNMPCFSVYYGETILCRRPDNMAQKAEALQKAAWGYYTDEPTHFPAHPGLARHLIAQAIGAGFDIAASQSQPQGLGMSHAYTFMYRRLLDAGVPMVPVFINTYFPPNQPRISRVVEFGRMLRSAVENFGEDSRVVAVASGGLSHFLVDERLDRSVLEHCTTGDVAALAAIGEGALKSGNSEIKNWAALAGMMAPERMELVEYVPAYRSPAGTGCGLAFGLWKGQA
jgi:3-O-methylgallate 3,4-dioxygenase